MLHREPEGADREGVLHRTDDDAIRCREEGAIAIAGENAKDRPPVADRVRRRVRFEALIGWEPELAVHFGIHGFDEGNALQPRFAEQIELRLRSADDREVAAHPHQLFSRRIEIKLANEYHAAIGHILAEMDLDAHDRDLAPVHAHREDRITTGVPVVGVAIVGEWMHRKHRITPSAIPATTHLLGGVTPEEQRQPISVQRRDRPSDAKEAEGGEGGADGL